MRWFQIKYLPSQFKDVIPYLKKRFNGNLRILPKVIYFQKNFQPNFWSMFSLDSVADQFNAKMKCCEYAPRLCPVCLSLSMTVFNFGYRTCTDSLVQPAPEPLKVSWCQSYKTFFFVADEETKNARIFVLAKSYLWVRTGACLRRDHLKGDPLE